MKYFDFFIRFFFCLPSVSPEKTRQNPGRFSRESISILSGFTGKI